jgi:hypothetical protein
MPGPSKQGLIVQPRDTRLLAELGLVRVADREQAKCLGGFSSTTRANTRLLALTRAGLISRFFMGTNGVGRKALYTLSPRGAKLVGSSYHGLRRAKDEFLIGDFFVHHQLSVNEVYCAVKYRPIAVPGTSFVRWVFFTEPVAPGLALIPDGLFELRMRDQIILAFVEVDLGTETRSVWQAKVSAYLRYATSGHFAEQFGDRPFRVLAIAHSGRRTASLRAATADITEKIFWFASFDSIEREGLWSAIWRRPKDDLPQPLFPNL